MWNQAVTRWGHRARLYSVPLRGGWPEVSRRKSKFLPDSRRFRRRDINMRGAGLVHRTPMCQREPHNPATMLPSG